MKLNAVETALMHNPVRTWLQRHYELPLLMRLGGDISGLRVLEIGCGRGVGTQLLIEQGRAGQVWAFDLDPAFVAQARARLSSWSDRRVQLTVADAEAIPAVAQSFDAVFDFGIIHHVPAWRNAVAEVQRVLKPGGRFFFEEVTAQALSRWAYRAFLRHPTEDRFSAEMFIAELQRHGIDVTASTSRCFGDFVIGVGRRRAENRTSI